MVRMLTETMLAASLRLTSSFDSGGTLAVAGILRLLLVRFNCGLRFGCRGGIPGLGAEGLRSGAGIDVA